MRVRTAWGFTLLELMFVVAIIGILAGLAIPQYQGYLVRARISEGLIQSSVATKAVADYYSFHGRFPADNLAAGLPQPTAFAGEYMERLDLVDGAIHIRYRRETMGAEWQGDAVVLTLRPASIDAYPPGNTLAWLCGQVLPVSGMLAHGEDRTTIPAEYLPPSCS